MNLSRSRLRPPGSAGAGPGAFAAPAAAVVLLLAGGWCAWAWTRPLARVEDPGGRDLPASIAINTDPTTMDDRTDRINAFAQRNLFDDTYAFWSAPPASSDVADSTDTETNSAGNTPPPVPIDLDQVRNNAPGDIKLTAEEDLPPDTKQARANLELRGLYLDPNKQPVAMMGFKQSANRGKTTPRRAADVFVDEKFDGASWVVAKVDMNRFRVVLVRNGATVAVDLYPSALALHRARGAKQHAPNVDAPGAPQGDAPAIVVQEQSREEIVADLREQGIPEADILAVLDAMLLPTDGVEIPVTVLGGGTPKAAPKLSEEDAEVLRSAPTMPEGLLEMLTQGAQRAEELKNEQNNEDEPGEDDN